MVGGGGEGDVVGDGASEWSVLVGEVGEDGGGAGVGGAGPGIDFWPDGLPPFKGFGGGVWVEGRAVAFWVWGSHGFVGGWC